MPDAPGDADWVFTTLAAIEFGIDTRVLAGTAHDDVIWAGDTVNRIYGGDGYDIIDGNGGRDRILGGRRDDVLNGGDHRDTLIGGAGGDVLDGGNGNDVIIGGRDDDRMRGGQGADRFVFDDGDAPNFFFHNQILDFDAAEGDLIDLAPIDAIPGGADGVLVWRGAGEFSGFGQVRLVETGGNTLIYVNLSGDKSPQMLIEIAGLANLTADAFVL